LDLAFAFFRVFLAFRGEGIFGLAYEGTCHR
jgi:hypothetical protein